MNQSVKKKNSHLSHRRVKTDFGGNMDSKPLSFVIKQKLIQSETQRSRIDYRSTIYSRKGSDSTRSYARTPTQAHEYTYNKWYIQPNVRMKKSLATSMKPKEEDIQFAYNQLYAENTLREDFPFLVNKNEKLKLLEQIPVHNIKLLEAFKKNQQLKKKRVPKIIELFLKNKQSPQKHEENFIPRHKI